MNRQERPRAAGREGFTLVEVLVAMVILAIGLLALEALAIGSARMVARADRESQYTALATEHMERVLERIDQGQNPASDRVDEADGSVVQWVVNRVALGAQFVYTVSVTVTPPAYQTTLQPITVVGRALQ